MMPLVLAPIGEENIIKKIGQENREYLEHLGFVVGGSVTIVTSVGGNIIVNLNDSRIAISREMAQGIMV